MSQKRDTTEDTTGADRWAPRMKHTNRFDCSCLLLFLYDVITYLFYNDEELWTGIFYTIGIDVHRVF